MKSQSRNNSSVTKQNIIFFFFYTQMTDLVLYINLKKKLNSKFINFLND